MVSLILMGGDLRMFVDYHAAIVIFGGSFAATLIRFPLSSIFHGLPLGAKFALVPVSPRLVSPLRLFQTSLPVLASSATSVVSA